MERVRLLDVLRGFAILGTLGTNIWLFASLGDFGSILTFNQEAWWTSVDDALRTFTMFIVNGKFLGMLTIMFGIGLEFKRRKAERLGQVWPGIYLWTSFLLLLDGAIHYFLVMEYDILMSYAVTAIIVAYIVKGGDRAVKRGMYIAGGIHLLLLLLIHVVLATAAGGGTSGVNEVALLFKEGTWLEQLQFRFNNFWFYRTESIIILPMNICLFLLGIRLVRSGAFAPDERGQVIRRKMLRWGIGIGLPLNLLLFVPGAYADLFIRYVAAPILALGYIGLIAKMVETGRLVWLWARFEEVGKAALSCYMLQNILASILFYGWGFGLGNMYGSAFTIAMWAFISCLLIGFAHIWLRYFSLGPVEWVWRQLSQLPSKHSKSSISN
ncbi:DUF418 domain-containing protein [Paenibacillus sp. 481]|uniref:DUF418 domain-containing protein n=1 Tax=Paenibacillus sp. 481 TaxID=2835869 RepID=UPI001E2A3AA8|nr:DUF418 domain-containing protein [Paenibacillus sp. 481]UHA73787.1 DUF418 domain-containing protein [Paenibacillus sp. 481]